MRAALSRASAARVRRVHRQQGRRWPTLSLVALMDVFTILVFFFLVHSADTTSQTYADLVELPLSTASEAPRETPVVIITPTDVLLQGEAVATVEEVLRTPAGNIPALRTALGLNVPAPDASGDEAEPAERELTIMGDRNIPYEVLDRVMRTCTAAGFGGISLTVLQRDGGAA